MKINKDEYGWRSLEYEENEKNSLCQEGCSFVLRKDGCVDIRTNPILFADGTPQDEGDYIHFCDLDELINALIELKKLRGSDGTGI